MAACDAAASPSLHVPGTKLPATAQVHLASGHLPPGAHVPRARVNYDEVQPAMTPLGLHCLVVTGHGWPICISAIVDWPWRSHNAGPRPPLRKELPAGCPRLLELFHLVQRAHSANASQAHFEPVVQFGRRISTPATPYFRMLLLDWRRSIFALTH
ncbi:hypothetical protein MGU_03507 [Metarhizium guizhouense ARSEF 977]|uniref:Uncharacterized protein n=1 Tax=Metarhizium guizhouense (strain ARSEF 977) TaxID=1276136 RepID=A0A0B4GQB9_METGA|nr:hypothetical protein MGU_03507 [Metarhizium guizhouense ARSEF 977]